MATLWDRLFRQTTRVIRNRATESIRGRGSVSENENGELVLQLYPRSDSKSLISIPCDELITTASPNDAGPKWASGVGLAAMLMMPALYFLDRSDTGQAGSDLDSFFLYSGATFFLTVTTFVALIFLFLSMEREWQKVIQQLFDRDMKTKMFGIKRTIIVYRRYIKWRRTMGYILVISWTFMPLEIAWLFYLQFVQTPPAGFSLHECMYLTGAVALQLTCISIYSVLRWFYTSRRDPTLPLCVMLAEENRELIAEMQRGTR